MNTLFYVIITLDAIKDTLPYLGTLLTGIAAWHKDLIKAKFGFKKETEEIKNSELDNLEKNFEIYQSLIDNLRKTTSAHIADLEDRFNLRIETLQNDLKNLQEVNTKLSQIIKDLKIKLNQKNDNSK